MSEETPENTGVWLGICGIIVGNSVRPGGGTGVGIGAIGMLIGTDPVIDFSDGIRVGGGCWDLCNIAWKKYNTIPR